jgi:uncharacterized protein (TIGR04255 family)
MRQTPGLKLERSPLQFVLVQVRFSPVTAMREYVPPLQDKLRKSGFPGFNKEQIQQVTFGPEPTAETSTRWCFVSRDKREGVVLTEDFVVYETTRYDVFETFAERVSNVLSELNAVAEIGFASQIGLRYVDVVRPLDGHPSAWFVREQFQGLSAESIEEAEVINQFLSVVKTPEGHLKLKSLEGRGPGFMPPDLETTRLEFDLQLTEEDEFRILDFDHVWKGEIDFVPDDIVSRMWALHGSIEKTFKATVTREAMAVWESKGDK